MFDEIVATRMVFQNSVALFAAASETSPLTDLSYITMLQENLNAVKLQDKHSGRSIKDDILPELNGLVNDFNALTAEQKTVVLADIDYTKNTSSTATRNALRTALNAQAAINERLAIASVTIADNKAYASTAGEDNTVRVLGYGVGINLDAKSEGKTVYDTTSIVVELYKGETLLGQQTFKGFEKHKDASSISGTIDAGGEYVATSWDNSWSAKIDQIPDKAKAIVVYSDGTAAAEMALNFTEEQTKIFYAADAVYALFTNPFADAETLELKEGVTQENITTALSLVDAVGEGSSHKTLFGEMINKANALLGGDEGTEQEANIEMMQFVPEKPIAEEPLETEDETEAAAEETTESDEATTDGAVKNEVNEEGAETIANEEPVSEPEVEDEETA